MANHCPECGEGWKDVSHAACVAIYDPTPRPLCQVLNHKDIEVGIETVYFTGTYDECLEWMRRAGRPTRFDIGQIGGRLLSWAL